MGLMYGSASKCDLDSQPALHFKCLASPHSKEEFYLLKKVLDTSQNTQWRKVETNAKNSLQSKCLTAAESNAEFY